jgi:hypothetical protein
MEAGIERGAVGKAAVRKALAEPAERFENLPPGQSNLPGALPTTGQRLSPENSSLPWTTRSCRRLRAARSGRRRHS